MAAPGSLVPLSSAFRCAGCRRSIWAAFASSLNCPASPRTPPRASCNQRKRDVQSRGLHAARALASNRREAQDEADDAREKETAQGQGNQHEPMPGEPEPYSALDALEASTPPKSKRAPRFNDDGATPWYLQETSAPLEPEVNPFAERQRIPETPEHSPPMLEPLLKHVSIDLGLDYLSLIDLRSMDPPPAFGANLIMLVGSARSEKHLNVSADRLCRWLRNNYKLTPQADGLLGRNELKLKMKRKNRRSRIMNAAGGSTLGADDGISTGWICVNAGTVEGGILPADAQDTSAATGFIGFSSGSSGAKVVVQIMTEEKRGDVDLEGLWQAELDRYHRRSRGQERARQKELDQDVREEDEASDVWSLRLSVSEQAAASAYESVRNKSTGHALSDHSSPFQQAQQTRDFHSYVRRSQVSPADAVVSATGDSVPPSFQAHPSSTRQLPPMPEPAQDAHSPRITTHWKYLSSLPPQQALLALGDGESDRDSTPFLASYYSSTPTFRRPIDFRLHLLLHTHAINLGHPGYTRDHLLMLLREAQASSVEISRDLFLTCLCATLKAHNVLNISYNTFSAERAQDARKESRAVLRRVMAYAKEIFEIMEIYGEDLRAKDIYTILHDAVMDPVFEAEHTHVLLESVRKPWRYANPPESLRWAYHNASLDRNHIFFPRSEMVKNVRNAITHMYRPAPTRDITQPPRKGYKEKYLPLRASYDTGLYKHVLRSYLRSNDWSDLWGVWRQLATEMKRRDEEMYAVMFSGQAGYLLERVGDGASVPPFSSSGFASDHVTEDRRHRETAFVACPLSETRYPWYNGDFGFETDEHGTYPSTRKQEECRKTIEEWWLEMQREEPPIAMEALGGEVARSLRRCLVAARMPREGSGRPFEDVWRGVDRVLGSEGEGGR